MSSIEFWKDVAAIAASLSAFAAFCFAIYGINAWRREYVGKRKIELAEEVLVLFYEAKEIIAYMRHPTSYSSEVDEIKKLSNETEEEWNCRKNSLVPLKRLQEHKESTNKLRSLRYRFMAIVSKEDAKPFDDLQKVINEILLAANRLSRLWRARNPLDEKTIKRIELNESIFWSNMTEDDEIANRVDKIVAQIEETCRKIIEGKQNNPVNLWEIFKIPERN
jgi:hypothetical protein